MAALLDHSDLTQIRSTAIAAGLAIPPRDALFMGIEVAVRSMVYSQAAPADALTIEIDRLNTYVDPTSTNGYHLAVWLTNAADKLAAARPAEAQFFRDMAAKVAAIPPPAPAPINTGDVVSGARAEEQSNQKVGLAVGVLRGSMPGVNRRTTNLMVSKRLHDTLHYIQLHILPLWNTAMGAVSSDPAIATMLIGAQLRQLSDRSNALPAEFGFLPPAEDLRKMAQATADRLIKDCDAAEAALAAKDNDALRGALAKVRDTVKTDMPLYAARMESYREGLDLSELGIELTVMAEHAADATLKDNATRLASTLAAIAQDLNAIGPRHSQWQLLDVRLATAESLFGFLSLGPAVYSTFNLEWDAVNAAIASLSADLPSERFDRVRALRDDFLAVCPVPVTAAPAASATGPFEAFVSELRTVFYEVDWRLRDICNQLREVTSQLAQL